MCRIEADIALQSWLFRFRLCSGQGKFTLHVEGLLEGLQIAEGLFALIDMVAKD